MDSHNGEKAGKVPIRQNRETKEGEENKILKKFGAEKGQKKEQQIKRGKTEIYLKNKNKNQRKTLTNQNSNLTNL